MAAADVDDILISWNAEKNREIVVECTNSYVRIHKTCLCMGRSICLNSLGKEIVLGACLISRGNWVSSILVKLCLR
jgi:hypothetical protein